MNKAVRKTIIAGNWKMNMTPSAAKAAIAETAALVAGKDGWIHFDYVPWEPDVRTGKAGIIGRLCVIGAELDREALSELFSVELK